MIHIEKDFDAIPESLKPATKDFFPGIEEGKYPLKSTTTHDYRKNMIASKRYIDNSRYKEPDVKNALESLYHGKCAYCEKRTGLAVEHYRPKRQYPPVANNAPCEYQPHDGYYWLSLSWDNLLLACDECNTPKSSKFDIEGSRATLNSREINSYRNIHKLSAKYDATERPKQLNPEVDNPNEHLRFSADGHVEGITERGTYTCKVCKLDRDKLVEDRKEIIDHFKVLVESIAAQFIGDKQSMVRGLKSIVDVFKRESEDQQQQFIGFRHQAHDFLRQVIVSVLSQ